ncbi:laccase-1 [Xylariaceae sp. FL0255]|nr:laccase-1 [Xylariaceae sp. FL0255]
MVYFFTSALVVLAYGNLALAMPATPTELTERTQVVEQRAVCTNDANNRNCWSDGFDINTDFYLEVPDTGVTVEYWISVENSTCMNDGVPRDCLTFNGTVPGPLLVADWGDTLKVHVTNNLAQNGTTVHWHGIRQLNSTEMDGVPGVSQCPIPPGETMTYEMRLMQYGTTWYHSHFTFQYGDGILGPLTINGPASANYDIDAGTLFLSDWSHIPIMTLWGGDLGGLHTLDNILVNGTNTYEAADDTITGSKYELVFEQGKTYRIRLINVAIDAFFGFHIDGHNFTVIATDLVPIQPFVTDRIQVGIGQRYDIIVEANADPGNYWIRSGFETACNTIGNNGDVSANGTGILRYDSTSTDDPTTEDTIGNAGNCLDIDSSLLQPVVEVDVTDLETVILEDLSITGGILSYATWTLNGSTFYLDWAEPTVKQVEEGNTSYSDFEQIVEIGSGFDAAEWAVLVIDTTLGVNHPIHMHGHDFFILAQETDATYVNTSNFNFNNPPRRDVAVLPASGYLALGLQLDNPGAWMVHCHIAWHASGGLAMQLLESKESMLTSGALADWDSVGSPMCSSWETWATTDEIWPQDDSGI